VAQPVGLSFLSQAVAQSNNSGLLAKCGAWVVAAASNRALAGLVRARQKRPRRGKRLGISTHSNALTRFSCIYFPMKNLIISLDEKTAALIGVYAAKRGMSVSRYVGELLNEHMTETRQSAAPASKCSMNSTSHRRGRFSPRSRATAPGTTSTTYWLGIHCL
jgi:hypothetical protein